MKYPRFFYSRTFWFSCGMVWAFTVSFLLFLLVETIGFDQSCDCESIFIVPPLLPRPSVPMWLADGQYIVVEFLRVIWSIFR